MVHVSHACNTAGHIVISKIQIFVVMDKFFVFISINNPIALLPLKSSFFTSHFHYLLYCFCLLCTSPHFFVSSSKLWKVFYKLFFDLLSNTTSSASAISYCLLLKIVPFICIPAPLIIFFQNYINRSVDNPYLFKSSAVNKYKTECILIL